MDSKSGFLSYCGQECTKIPSGFCRMYGETTRYLDLSYNNLETLKGLENFPKLEELILDNNNLGDNITFPSLPRLKTLSLNNNEITDLESLISKLQDKYPALTYLSLLGNKACPDQLSDLEKDASDYQRYRYFVLYNLKQLRFLDSRCVKLSEHVEANSRGAFMSVRRPRVEEQHHEPRPSARPLPVDFASLGKHKGAYGKCNYKYTGKHSEGNRFILNSDL
ncbi:leucine-rich melanocyte differentiation-associated protein-like [Aricia agestis]|uniref:leucine-rich melanocyte differentiation-associated protein-like n=1 Tax=Aricia agestis TaxID=91739 RepID=UPI001C2050FA|nr:leucine-rich melanocyte differentiation-associated protein-like [Aricia agestis]